MSVFGAVCGRKGDGGFSGPLLGACSGVVGFIVAMFLRAVRGICRPARPDVCASTKKFALRAHNGQKLAFDGALGKYFRGPAVVGSRRASLLCRVPGSRAPLLAVLTRRVSEALCMRFNPQSRRRVRNNDCCVPEEA